MTSTLEEGEGDILPLLFKLKIILRPPISEYVVFVFESLLREIVYAWAGTFLFIFENMDFFSHYGSTEVCDLCLPLPSHWPSEKLGDHSDHRKISTASRTGWTGSSRAPAVSVKLLYSSSSVLRKLLGFPFFPNCPLQPPFKLLNKRRTW